MCPIRWYHERGVGRLADQIQSMVYPVMALYEALGGRFGDLSRPQLRLMMKLSGDPPTISALADSLNISSPGVTQMIDKLQNKGYVERHSQERDQRLVRVRMTDSGRAALAIAEAAFGDRVEQVLSPLSDQERDTLLEILDKLHLKSGPPAG